METSLNLSTQVIKKLILASVLCVLLVFPAYPGVAQENAPEGAYYIVQPGDSLWNIALRFKVSMDDLARANGISDPSQLVAGARLTIPGLPGIQGELITSKISFGDNLRSLSRQYQVSEDMLRRLNHLASPNELYIGATFVLPAQATGSVLTTRNSITPGYSLLELAASKGANPWTYVLSNGLAGTWQALPGDPLYLPGAPLEGSVLNQPGGLPDTIQATEVNAPLVQGKVMTIKITGLAGMELGGLINGNRLQIYPLDTTHYAGLQGIHAMTDPGLYTLVITGSLPAEAPYFSAPFAFSQAIPVVSGGYPFDPVLVVSPETIDPAVTRPEDAQWAALAAPATPQKLWSGIFRVPVPDIYKDCWPSLFGNRRSYNGSAYSYFHTGLDFCGGVGTEIYAPAAGRVVFAGPLTVRGNATMIDHGWGVYSGYLHQSEILVSVGDLVEAGQLIGKVGGTGRVTGPHLHWEIWSGGVQVDPLDWLAQEYP